MLRPLYMFFSVFDFTEVEWPTYQNIQYCIRSENFDLNFTAVRYSFPMCSEMILF